jgi:hypothetical protein
VFIGFVIHAVVYATLVGETEPKSVYWGYTLPFIYLGAACAFQQAALWWRSRRLPSAPLRLGWFAAAVVLIGQSTIDYQVNSDRKPDWRGVSSAIAEKIDPSRDVVFCCEAQVYGTAGMVFRVSPHYWPTDEHVVNVLRDPKRLFNGGQPILDRRGCRVALMMRCDPDLDGAALAMRMSARSKAAFEFQDSHQFFALTSRASWQTPDEGLIALAGVVDEMLGRRSALGVHMQMGLARVLAKRGHIAEAARIHDTCRQLVLPQHRASFDETYRGLAELITLAAGPFDREDQDASAMR